MRTPNPKETKNIFIRMHPMQRILAGLLIASGVYFIISKLRLGFVLNTTILWDSFALPYILICIIVFFKRSREEIIKQANKDDGSRVFVFISILITSLAGMFAVFLLMSSKSHMKENQLLSIPVALLGMISSWMLVHTLFTFHYAHMYYEGEADKKEKLNFPGKVQPDYLDFAYFSFVIGMTFQVSDVEVHSARIRRIVLLHGLIAFALNTFVVALMINLIAGLSN